MRYFSLLTSLGLVLFASTALALVAAGDAGDQAPPAPSQDAGVADPLPPAADAGTDRLPPADAGSSIDAGAYPDSGCADGVCCLVLPNWDAGSYDIGALDTGRRRRTAVDSDAGDAPPEDGMFGCSASGAASLFWLLPLLATRRRRSV
jgi:hypothetical protein